MNRTVNEVRKLFLGMLQKPNLEISTLLQVHVQTIKAWRKILKEENGEILLLKEPNKNTRKPEINLELLEKDILENPDSFDKERALLLGVSDKTVFKWRKKLGYKRKRFATTPKEADPIKKKNVCK